MSSKATLRLDWCSHAAAKYAVEHWHYSRSLPTPPLVKIGVWENERFIGCVLFSRGATQNIGAPFGLPQTEVAELTRIALDGHRSPVSRVLKLALVFLRQQCPGLRLLVSYADPGHGHVGGVYQASGWLYLGQRDGTTEYIGPDGKRWHARMVSPTGQKRVYGHFRSVWRPDQCQPVACPGKHKYALPLDNAMRAQIAPLAKPYPKRSRAGSLDSEAVAIHATQGGAIPTSALHEDAA
jgi:hypothetical protein